MGVAWQSGFVWSQGVDLDWSSKFASRITLPLEGNWEGLVDFRGADFDGDGAVDLLYADRQGVWVCWGTCNGELGPATRVLDRRGTIRQIAFEEEDLVSHYPRLLWLKCQGPDGKFMLEGYRFYGRSFEPFRQLTESFDGAMRCTGHGILFGKCASDELVIERFGALSRLGTFQEAVDGLDLADLDGDGRDDLVVHSSGRLGVGFALKEGGYEAFSWVPSRFPVDAWDVQRDASGQTRLLLGVKDHDQVVCWTRTDGAWESLPIGRAGVGRLINHHSEQFGGAALMHHPLNQLLYFLTYDIATAAWRTNCLTEVSEGSSVHPMDWNLDGVDDVVALDAKDRKLHVMLSVGKPCNAPPVWSRSVLEMLKPATVQSDALPMPMPQQWGREIAGAAGAAEWILASSVLVGLGPSGTQVLREVQQPRTPMEGDAEDAQPCFSINYLEYSAPGALPCLRLKEDREWHHVTYTRNAFGETHVVLDDELVFSGTTEDQHFDHRMVQIGAAFGTVWSSFSAVALDELAIHRVHLDAPVAMQFHRGEFQLDPAVTVGTVALDGEDPWRAEPSFDAVSTEGGVDLISTPWGKGLRFDGSSGHAHVFLDVPEDEITVDFRFKLLAPVTGPMCFVNLYGMYNQFFGVNLGNPVEGVAGSPDRFTREVISGTDGHLLNCGGKVCRMLPNGSLVELTDGGWVALPVRGRPGSLQGAPWTANGAVWGVFGEGGDVWKLTGEVGDWQEVAELRRPLCALDHAVSTGRAAFIWSDGGELSGWLDAEANRFYPLQGDWDVDQIAAVRPTTGGIEWMSTEGTWRRLRHPAADDAFEPAFEEGGLWERLAGIAVAVLLVGWGMRAMHRQRNRKRASFVVLEANAQVQGVLRVLTVLVERAGERLESHELDELLGYGDVMTDETRRSRRSRVLNEVNAWSRDREGFDLVERSKDPMDRRRSVYVVREEVRALLAQLEKDLA